MTQFLTKKSTERQFFDSGSDDPKQNFLAKFVPCPNHILKYPLIVGPNNSLDLFLVLKKHPHRTAKSFWSNAVANIEPSQINDAILIWWVNGSKGVSIRKNEHHIFNKVFIRDFFREINKRHEAYLRLKSNSLGFLWKDDPYHCSKSQQCYGFFHAKIWD